MNPKSTATRRLLPWLASCLVAIGSLLAPAPPHAQPTPNAPDRKTYQGFLVDSSGAALANTGPKNYDIIFRIYNDPNAGQVLWAEQQTVTVDRGNFSVILGEGVDVPGQAALRQPLSTIFKGATASERYIALTVKGIGPSNTDADIMPRLRFLASPYAFLAQQATKIVKADGTDLLSANNSFLSLDGSLGIRGNNSLQFGAGIVGKEANAGTIAYGGWTADTLDIVGAGTTGNNRQVKVWAEGGSTFNGPVTAAGTVTAPRFVGDGTVPVGCIVMWSGSIATIPDGWTLCDGSRGTPDLRSRFVVGASGSVGPSGLTRRDPAAMGGSETRVLTVAQIPAHSHSFTDVFFAEHNGNYGIPGNVGSGKTDHDNWGFGMTSLTASAGGGQPFEIMPPFYSMAFIMRIR